MRGCFFLYGLIAVTPYLARAQVPQPKSKPDSIARADSIAKADSIALVQQLVAGEAVGGEGVGYVGKPVGSRQSAVGSRQTALL